MNLICYRNGKRGGEEGCLSFRGFRVLKSITSNSVPSYHERIL